MTCAVFVSSECFRHLQHCFTLWGYRRLLTSSWRCVTSDSMNGSSLMPFSPRQDRAEYRQERRLSVLLLPYPSHFLQLCLITIHSLPEMDYRMGLWPISSYCSLHLAFVLTRRMPPAFVGCCYSYFGMHTVSLQLPCHSCRLSSLPLSSSGTAER